MLVPAVLIAGAVGSVYETLNLLDANKWVAHTLEVLNQVEQTYMELRDAEAAQRGYVITGDEFYLAGFRRARSENRSNAASAPAVHRPTIRDNCKTCSSSKPSCRNGWTWRRALLRFANKADSMQPARKLPPGMELN